MWSFSSKLDRGISRLDVMANFNRSDCNHCGGTFARLFILIDQPLNTIPLSYVILSMDTRVEAVDMDFPQGVLYKCVVLFSSLAHVFLGVYSSSFRVWLMHFFSVFELGSCITWSIRAFFFCDFIASFELISDFYIVRACSHYTKGM